LKRVLIISPYFPPSNAADMQRVRMSLPFFKQYGWDAEVVAVDAKYSEMVKDELLLQSIPADIKIHYVHALTKKITSKFGLGNLALRSMIYYLIKVNKLLKSKKYDLIYFSTTQFPITILGPYWKKRFKVPYVIDMQDPWHSDYYQNKPVEQQPKKYWFSYRLNKFLEPIAIKQVDGLISVSGNYISNLKDRYPQIKDIPTATITFGAFRPDVKIAADNENKFKRLFDRKYINIVYVGRGGGDMHKAITPVFKALQKGLANQPKLFNKLKFFFIGTSYAPVGEGIPTIMPLAKVCDVADNVVEITDRISYYNTLSVLRQADALFIPGSEDPAYTASKIYPYLLMQKPLLAIFHKNSSAVNTINECAIGATVLTFPHTNELMTNVLYDLFEQWANGLLKPVALLESFTDYTAEALTYQQTRLFKKANAYFEAKNTNA
jgi:hypothetical protein